MPRARGTAFCTLDLWLPGHQSCCYSRGQRREQEYTHIALQVCGETNEIILSAYVPHHKPRKYNYKYIYIAKKWIYIFIDS